MQLPADIPSLFKVSRFLKTSRMGFLVIAISRAASKLSIASLLRAFELAALWGTIILIPLRLRLFTLARPRAPIYADFTDFILFASDIFLILALFFWMLSVAVRPRPLTLGPRFLTLPLAGILLFSLVSIPFSIDTSLSLYHFIRMLLLFGFYLFLLNEIKDLKLVIFPVGIQVFIQSVTAVLQVLGQRSIGLSFLGELELDPSWSGVSIVWAEGIRSLRAYGLTDHPNILGGCLSFGLILIAYGYLSSAAWRRTLFSALFCLGILGIFYTFSRAAWLSAALGLTLLGLWQIRNGRIQQIGSYLGLLAAGLIVLAPFLLHNLSYVGVRLNQQGSFTQNDHEKQAIGERMILNRNANNIFLAEPFTGVGLGAFPIALQAQQPDYPYNFQPAHIVLLDVAAETGIFGASFYLLVIISPWVAIWLNRNRLAFNAALLAASSLLLATMVVGFFDYYTWLLNAGRLWQWLAWGLWAGIYSISLREESHA
jgi:O-antigen ligase